MIRPPHRSPLTYTLFPDTTLVRSYRESLFPEHAYRRAWQAFDAQLDGRQACRDAVALLDIAARGDCVDVLARRIDEALDSGRLPDVDALRDEFLPTAR